MTDQDEEELVIGLIGGETGETAVFRVADTLEAYHLSCAYRGKVLKASAQDWFDALREVRREMMQDGVMPHCYGASLNVWPSGMSSDMGGAWMAYRLTMGRAALTEDMVEIFSTGPDVQPSTVEAQEAFANEWLAQFRK